MKVLDMVAAYMPHVSKGNKIIRDVLERLDMPLKKGMLGKTPARINNSNNTRKAHLEACFGKFRLELNEAIMNLKLLNNDLKSDTIETKKKIIVPFFNFSKSYLQVFTTLLSFKYITSEKCREFSRVLKIANDDDVEKFYEDLLTAHGHVRSMKDKVMDDEEAERVAEYIETVEALKAIESFPQPPSRGGAKRRRTVRHRRREAV